MGRLKEIKHKSRTRQKKKGQRTLHDRHPSDVLGLRMSNPTEMSSLETMGQSVAPPTHIIMGSSPGEVRYRQSGVESSTTRRMGPFVVPPPTVARLFTDDATGEGTLATIDTGRSGPERTVNL